MILYTRGNIVNLTQKAMKYRIHVTVAIVEFVLFSRNKILKLMVKSHNTFKKKCFKKKKYCRQTNKQMIC